MVTVMWHDNDSDNDNNNDNGDGACVMSYLLIDEVKFGDLLLRYWER